MARGVSVASDLSELSALVLGGPALRGDTAAVIVIFGPLSGRGLRRSIVVEESRSGGRAAPLSEGLHEEDAPAAGALNVDDVADLDAVSGLDDAIVDLAQLAVAGVSSLRASLEAARGPEPFVCADGSGLFGGRFLGDLGSVLGSSGHTYGDNLLAAPGQRPMARSG